VPIRSFTRSGFSTPGSARGFDRFFARSPGAESSAQRPTCRPVPDRSRSPGTRNHGWRFLLRREREAGRHPLGLLLILSELRLSKIWISGYGRVEAGKDSDC